MSGIDRELTLETRTSLIDKHLPGTHKPKANLKAKELSFSLMIGKQWKESPPKLRVEGNAQERTIQRTIMNVMDFTFQNPLVIY
jgi:hypothetical protein